jgi:DeoR/GlpR family transcriptional regulator of sugar metabolism
MTQERRTFDNPDERRTLILQQVGELGFSSVTQLASRLDVSEMTIRRDLELLANQGRITRHHGGASVEADAVHLEIPFYSRRKVHYQEKALIGRRAAQLIHPDEVIFLDNGTSTLEIVPHLSQERLTVITNNLPALHLLAKKRNINLQCLGGELLPDNQCFIGPQAVAAVQKLYADVAVMATTGLSIERGLTNRVGVEAELKTAMIANAGRVILLMESAKLNHQTLYRVCDLKEVDVLVTDSGMPDADIRSIEACGVQVLVAEVEGANGNRQDQPSAPT